MEKKVSVIVPVYNAEKYLKECVDSIVNQTYNNFEVILINDGSIDNSKNICEEYEKKYENIKVLNIENHGVSYSRNLGIEQSNGEYIIFIDSDDYIKENMIEELIKIQEEHEDEFLIYNYSKVYNEIEKNKCNVPDKSISKKELLDKFFVYYNNLIINPPWNKMYKSKIIKDNNIRFNINFKIGEDLLFNLEYFKYCDKIKILDDSYYYYRINPSSVTNKYRENYYENQNYLLNKIRNLLEENQAFNEENQNAYREHKCNSIINSIQNLFIKSCPLSNSQKKEEIQKLVTLKEANYLKDMKYDLLQLKILRKLIIRKNVNLIIVFSVLKEKLKG